MSLGHGFLYLYSVPQSVIVNFECECVNENVRDLSASEKISVISI